MITRRTLLKRLGLVAGALGLPLTFARKATAQEVLGCSVEQYLTQNWNRLCKGNVARARGEWDVRADQDLFDSYEAGLPSIRRWTKSDVKAEAKALRYKPSTFRSTGRPGWGIEMFVDGEVVYANPHTP